MIIAIGLIEMPHVTQQLTKTVLCKISSVQLTHIENYVILILRMLKSISISNI